MEKNKRNIKKLLTKIVAILLAAMMVLSVAITIIYYIVMGS